MELKHRNKSNYYLLKGYTNKKLFGADTELNKLKLFKLGRIDHSELSNGNIVTFGNKITCSFSDIKVIKKKEQLQKPEEVIQVQILYLNRKIALTQQQNEKMKDELKTIEKTTLLLVAREFRSKLHDKRLLDTLKKREISIPISNLMIRKLNKKIMDGNIQVVKMYWGYEYLECTSTNIYTSQNWGMKDAFFFALCKLLE